MFPEPLLYFNEPTSIGITKLLLKRKPVSPLKTKGEFKWSLIFSSIIIQFGFKGVYGLEAKFWVVRPSSII
jgi:hypothetical protein